MSREEAIYLRKGDQERRSRDDAEVQIDVIGKKEI